MHWFGLRVLVVAFVLVSPAWSWPGWWPSWWWSRHDKHFERRNFNTISAIYNLTVYPNQLPIIGGGTAGVPPGLFSQDVVGRVDPVGEFIGFEDSIEYFFALAPVPQGNAASAAITGYQITEFNSACAGVATSVVFLFCSIIKPGSPEDGTPLPPLKQVRADKVAIYLIS
jgi:hypothetical protein